MRGKKEMQGGKGGGFKSKISNWGKRAGERKNRKITHNSHVQGGERRPETNSEGKGWKKVHPEFRGASGGGGHL